MAASAVPISRLSPSSVVDTTWAVTPSSVDLRTIALATSAPVTSTRL